HQVQLIDESCLQILTDDRHPTAYTHIAAARGSAGLLERDVDTPGDEVKLGAACHAEGWPRVMGEHEHRRVVGRLIAPPALPTLPRPRPPHRTKHVAPDDPGADALETLLGERVVDPGLAALFSVHPAPGARLEEPLHEVEPTHTDRILQILARAGAVAI